MKKSNTETETENFGFCKMKPKPNQKFGNGLIGFGQFVRVVSFLHTPNPHWELANMSRMFSNVLAVCYPIS